MLWPIHLDLAEDFGHDLLLARFLILQKSPNLTENQLPLV